MKVAFIFSLCFVLAIAQNPTCQKDWSYFAKSNKCYRAFGGAFDGVAQATWSFAEEYCNHFGDNGHLVTIHSDDEITFIVELCLQAEVFDDKGDVPIHIGLVHNGVDQWSWVDGSRVTYLKWWLDYRRDIAANPAGFLCTKREKTGYMWNLYAAAPWPFVCQMNPVTEGCRTIVLHEIITEQGRIAIQEDAVTVSVDGAQIDVRRAKYANFFVKHNQVHAIK